MVKTQNILIEYTKWLLKWAFIIFFSIILLLGGFIGYTVVEEWWNYERHKEKITIYIANEAAEELEENLPIVAAVKEGLKRGLITDEEAKEKLKRSNPLCSSEFPILVYYENNSSKTIQEISIYIQATLPGHSTNILDWSAKVDYDRIVPPGESWATCWKFPYKDEYSSNPETINAIYTGRISYIDFTDK